MTKFYNNVKSRLNKKGLVGFIKADYLKAAEHLEIVDLDDVTTEQIIAGVELLESYHDSQIKAVNNVNTDVYRQQEASAFTSPTPETLIHHQEAEIFAQQEIEDDEVNYAPLSEDTNEDAIASDEIDYSDADKRALTIQKSQELGITLSDKEINLIADSIEHCGESLDDLLDGIQSALVAYINHKTSLNTQKIDNALDAVVEYAEQKFNDNSQHLSNRLIKLGSEMEAVATRNKSQIKSILSRLAVPTDKAG